MPTQAPLVQNAQAYAGLHAIATPWQSQWVEAFAGRLLAVEASEVAFAI